MTNETFPLAAARKVNHNNSHLELIELAIRRDEGQFSSTGALVFHTGAHTGRSAQDKFTVRDDTTEKAVWWDNNKAISAEQFDLLYADFFEHAKTRELFVQDLYAGADAGAPAQHARLHRICLARAVHPLAAAPPGQERARWVSAPVHRRQPAELPGRPQTARRALRNGHRLQFRETPRADRRHVLRRRDQEIGLHLPQLSDARKGRDADALLGQCRQWWRFGRVLRTFRHGQDDAVGRSQTHAAGRRRARLVRHAASTISRAAATPRPSACPTKRSPRSGRLPTGSVRCSRT